VTISRTDSGLPRERFDIVEVDEHDDIRRCPLCGRRLGAESIATPDVPPSLLVDATVDVSARAYVCTRHRVDVVALEPADVAPDGFVPVESTLESRELDLAVPEPVVDREGLA